MTKQDLIQKLWSLSSILRDDGMVYHQYMTELTYLLFLKIASETRTERSLPKGYRWRDLVETTGEGQLGFYRKMLTHLGEDAPNRMVKEIFAFPTTVFKHPENLKIVVDRIDELEWHSEKRDEFGDVYEGLLEKNAGEVKSGAGQYFTPRPLIDCIVDLVKPMANETIQDPAAGTGGFLVSADRKATSTSGLRPRCEGIELVQDTYRLCLMNLFVHGIKAKLVQGDALSDDYKSLQLADVIVTNPPFGTRGGSGSPRRSDLPNNTSNKQLMFLQHIYHGLKDGGRAAVVLPDNVLFEGGVAQRIREELLRMCDLHTVLRLPTGIFYAGIKTNVLFFTRRDDSKNNSKHVWFYDARTNTLPFGKRSPITRQFFAEFEECFGNDPYGRYRKVGREKISRWKRFDRGELGGARINLDVRWLREKQQSDSVMDAEEIAAEISATLNSALSEVKQLSELLSAAQR